MIVVEVYVVALAALMFVASLTELPSPDMAGRTASIVQMIFGIGLIGVVLLVFQ